MKRALALGLLALPTCLAQTQPGPRFRSSASEVLLDVVVRNKKEQLVRDLKAEDFAVFEDGVQQNVKAFRFVDGRGEAPPSADSASTPAASSPAARGANSLREINLVSIVFHQMSGRSRDFAKEAALQFLKNELRGKTYIAVYSLDYRLNTLLPYTNNRDAVARAVEHATTGSASQFARESEQLMNQLDTQISGGPGGVSVASTVDWSTRPQASLMSADQTVGEGVALSDKIIHDQLRMFVGAAGTHVLDALSMFVKDQAQLPGRKTVLYLSEGLLVPPNRGDLLRNLISQANRANVAFYALDVRGLATTDAAQAGFNGLSGAAPINVAGLENRNLGAAGLHQDDKVQQALHADTQSSMEELAQGTGGFLIANTNEMKKPMLRIMEDVRTYYELAWQPASTDFDGHFRKIEVKLSRPGLQVRTRSGYYALPELNGEYLNSWEFAALGALNASPLPRAFSYRAAALHYRRGASGEQVIIALDLPIQELSVFNDKQQKLVRIHASLFALVKDAHGQVVAKVGQDIPTEVAEDRLAQLKAGHIIYSEPVALAPGRYTLETVVLDREGTRASARKAVLVIPEQARCNLSSIVLVRAVEPLPNGRNPADPLEFEGGKLTPELSGTAKVPATSLYFVVYPKDRNVKPQVALEFSKEGKVVGSTVPDLPAPDETGAIPYIATAKLEPGNYSIRAVMREGQAAAESTLSFTVEP